MSVVKYTCKGTVEAATPTPITIIPHIATCRSTVGKTSPKRKMQETLAITGENFIKRTAKKQFLNIDNPVSKQSVPEKQRLD